MLPRQDPPTALRRLADEQAGVVTTEQAVGLGLNPHALARLTSRGEWQRLARGALFTHSGPVPWEARAWAGVLMGGDRARLGAEASGFLYGLLSEAPDPVVVLVPFAQPVRVAGPWRFQRERHGVRSARSPGAPSRLTVEDTVVDLAEARGDGEVVTVVTAALRKRLTTPRRLQQTLTHRARHRHRRLLNDLLADVAEGVESALELRYLRDVERAHGLARGKRQRSRLGLRHRTDIGYEVGSLLVELDGRLGHEDEPFRDLRRDNDFALRDWLTLRYGWHDVTDRPCTVAFQVGAVLTARGWPGVVGRCRRCRAAPEALLRSA